MNIVNIAPKRGYDITAKNVDVRTRAIVHYLVTNAALDIITESQPDKEINTIWIV